MARPRTVLNPVKLTLCLSEEVRDLGRELSEELGLSYSKYVTKLILDALESKVEVSVDFSADEHRTVVDAAKRLGVSPTQLLRAATKTMLESMPSEPQSEEAASGS